MRIQPAAHTGKSRRVHGSCFITKTSAVKCMMFAANLRGISRVPGRSKVVQAGLPGPAAASSQQYYILSHHNKPLPVRQHAGKHGEGCGQQELTMHLPQNPSTPIGVMLRALV